MNEVPPPTDRQRLRRVFSEIHASRSWGGEEESVSGPGSSRQRAAAFLPDLLALVARLEVGTLLDAPCGDFNWAAPLADRVARYIGVDLVPELIERCRREHAAAHRSFHCLDMVHDTLPAADLVLCRDGWVHLGEPDLWQSLARFRASGAEYLLTTTFVGDRANEPIESGGWRPLNLERSPFDFPPPLAVVDERCLHSDGIYADKRLGLWRLSDLPG